MGFGVSEYTLVFRSCGRGKGCQATEQWTVVRPIQYVQTRMARERTVEQTPIARVFAVPICSALALEGVAYEQFLTRSGVLQDSLRLLSEAPLDDEVAVETARRRIQSLVMAAEVDSIVSGMMKGA